MKKKNRILYLFIVILLIWNVTLTIMLVNSNKEITNITDINQTTVTGFSTDLTKVFDDNKSSVVSVLTDNSISSGIIYKVSDDGIYIVCTYHGISDAENINVVFASGSAYDARIIGEDIFSDIAVVKVDTNFGAIPVKLGNTELLKNGEFLACIGTANDVQYASSNELAIVASNFRTIPNSIEYEDNKYDYYQTVIQISSNLKEGYSGAPIFNMAGEVQGLILMKNDTAVFALPINEIKIIADNIINGNEYQKIQFGFKSLFVNNLEIYEKNQLNIPLEIIDGLFISEVSQDSLGSSLGLKNGDIITAINNKKIEKYSDLLEIEYSNIETYEIKVIRDNEEILLTGRTDA